MNITTLNIDEPLELLNEKELGFNINKLPSGYQLVATQKHKKGEIICSGSPIPLNLNQQYLQGDRQYTISIHIKAKQNIDVNFQVKAEDLLFWNSRDNLFFVDAILGHAVNYNVWVLKQKTQVSQNWHLVALRDIEEGEQLSFNKLKTDENNQKMQKLQCLSLHDKEAHQLMFSLSTYQILKILKKNTQQLFLDILMPEGIELLYSKETKQWRMCATRDFKQGEMVFQNNSLIYNANKYNIMVRMNLFHNMESKTKIERRIEELQDEMYLQEVSHIIFEVEHLDHSINRGGKMGETGVCLRECYTFDSFMNHSCAPNVDTFYENNPDWNAVYFKTEEGKCKPTQWFTNSHQQITPELQEKMGLVDDNKNLARNNLLTDQVYGLSAVYYKCTANQPIKKGDEITCDYYLIDSMMDGTEFQCQCGAVNCRKIIKG